MVSALGIPSLAGCSETEEQEPIVAELSESTELVSLDSDEAEPKVFEPYEHFFFKRIDVLETHRFSNGFLPYADDIKGGQVEVPPGYIPFSEDNWNGLVSSSYQTRGVDIWFINTVPVKVQPVYNELTKCYEYTEPGEVILLDEESLEEKPKVLQKTQE